MSKRIFKTSAGHELELRRPTYKAFKNISYKVAALMDVEFDAAMSNDAFSEVLNACVVQNLGAPDQEDGILANLPYDEVAALWDAVIEHAEFDTFFATRRTAHEQRQTERMEADMLAQAKQIQVMKKSGLLPKDFSLERALNEGMTPALPNLIPTPPSSTSTPEPTDGTGEPSKTPTTSGSSKTSPRSSAGGKRSRN